MEFKSWQVWAAEGEFDLLKPRDRYSDLDVACEIADELVKQGFHHAVVRDMNGGDAYYVGR